MCMSTSCESSDWQATPGGPTPRSSTPGVNTQQKLCVIEGSKNSTQKIQKMTEIQAFSTSCEHRSTSCPKRVASVRVMASSVHHSRAKTVQRSISSSHACSRRESHPWRLQSHHSRTQAMYRSISYPIECNRVRPTSKRPQSHHSRTLNCRCCCYIGQFLSHATPDDQRHGFVSLTTRVLEP